MWRYELGSSLYMNMSHKSKQKHYILTFMSDINIFWVLELQLMSCFAVKKKKINIAIKSEDEYFRSSGW